MASAAVVAKGMNKAHFEGVLGIGSTSTTRPTGRTGGSRK
jgi:hypothetical protein